MKGVILTKDNLKKCNWNGDDGCCFCNNKETIQHLFFDCHVASFVWRIVLVAFGLTPPSNVSCFVSTWFEQVDSNMRPLLCVGVSAIVWSIWMCRNYCIFDRKRLYSYLQVIFRGTYWIRFWSLLQKEDGRNHLKWACRLLETVAFEVFAKNGWLSSRRLCV